jgi:uncharacterized protein YcfL
MADVVCAKSVRDVAVRYRIVRYDRCGVCKIVRDIAVRYMVVRYDRCGVCKNSKGHSGQI